MISENLFPRIQAGFGDRPMTIVGARQVVFSAAHSEVGDLVVQDDGDEVTLFLGRFTHCHIGNYDDGLKVAEREERISDEVIRFLEEIFADQVEFWGNHRGGNSRERKPKPRSLLSKLMFGSRTYVWSGPLESGSPAASTSKQVGIG